METLTLLSPYDRNNVAFPCNFLEKIMRTGVFGTALCTVIVIWLDINEMSVHPFMAFGFYLFGRIISIIDESEYRK